MVGITFCQLHSFVCQPKAEGAAQQCVKENVKMNVVTHVGHMGSETVALHIMSLKLMLQQTFALQEHIWANADYFTPVVIQHATCKLSVGMHFVSEYII